MNKNYIKMSFGVLVIILLLTHCTDQESNSDIIVPQKATANVDVLQKIKSLGFTENQIKETPNYYLADGDLYFSKKISNRTTKSAKKFRRSVQEKYATFTIHIDESLATVMDEHWRAGIDKAIAEWNADEEVHFHFAFTNSADATITIVKDTDLPKDLAIASEFPRDGRTGSTIRINVATTKVVEDPKQAFAHALEHCVGFLHSTSAKNKEAKSATELKNARGPRYESELYAIQGDILWRINAYTGEYYNLRKGWAGTEAMGQLNGSLYMVQYGMLYRVDPSTGYRTQLTEGWGGSQYIASLPGKLYIMQGFWIFPVNPTNGIWDVNFGIRYIDARGMVGYDNQSGVKGLVVLSAPSLLDPYVENLDPSNGRILAGTSIPRSLSQDWNGKLFITTRYWFQTVEVFNGASTMVSIHPPGRKAAGGRQHGPGVFSRIEHAVAYGTVIYIISKGSLYSYQPVAPNGEIINEVSQLGFVNDWVDTSCLVYLE